MVSWRERKKYQVIFLSLLKEAKLVLVCKKEYAADLKESGFIDKEVFEQAYPNGDLHTMYVGKIEKILVRDDEYLG